MKDDRDSGCPVGAYLKTGLGCRKFVLGLCSNTFAGAVMRTFHCKTVEELLPLALAPSSRGIHRPLRCVCRTLGKSAVLLGYFYGLLDHPQRASGAIVIIFPGNCGVVDVEARAGIIALNLEDWMPRVLRPYALAGASVVIALFLTILITPLHQHARLLLFILAVVVSANEGVLPGIFATVFSATLASYFLIPSGGWSATSDSGNLVRMLLFCGVNRAVTGVTHHFHRSDETILAAGAVIESLASVGAGPGRTVGVTA